MPAQKLSILIVDDEETICELLADVFEDTGFTIHTAHNGDEALKLIRDQSLMYDLIISDYHMPVMDGLKLLESIHQDLNYKPYFYLCSGTHDDVEETLNRFDKTTFIEKPYDAFSLVDKVVKELEESN